MSSKKDNLVNVANWQELINALESDYDLTIKECCKTLKCNRSWVDKYIRPYVHYIYISGHYSPKTKTNYLYLLSSYMQREIHENVWMHRDEFESLLRDNMSFTRQTIKIPIEWLIIPERKGQFQNKYYELSKQVAYYKWRDLGEYLHWSAEKRNWIYKNLTDLGKEIYRKLPDPKQRTETIPVPLEVPVFALMENLLAPHDLLDYGESLEMLYRNFFIDGYIRVDLEIPDITGKKSQKVYFLKPDKILHEDFGESVEYITISYNKYLQYFA